MSAESATEQDPEIVAISAVYASLKKLEPEAQKRVLNYVAMKLNIGTSVGSSLPTEIDSLPEPEVEVQTKERASESAEQTGEALEGISPVAKKWMTRNGLQEQQLSRIFSLGVDEIDLIAKTVPGKKKKEKMHNVFLLKGIAAYIGTGAARFTYEQAKETCLHYDAWDSTNFSFNFKSLAGEVSGSKDSGYALTPRGLSNGTELVKMMIQPTRS